MTPNRVRPEAHRANRFGTDVPLGDAVISPGAMFESPLLETVFEN